ncbi:centrosomal protein of 290 kDa-like [Haliotis cracherodii]|uniref:centrosomal protein of 290 kDa-like n=1 Tax=Haliotis cracherodii TaxID=6455 RepID=UPI0039EB8D09
MPPLAWDRVMAADASKLSEDDADAFYEMLSEGDVGGETDAGKLQQLFKVTKSVMMNRNQQCEEMIEEMEKETKAAKKKEQEMVNEQDKLKKEISDLKKFGGDGGGGGGGTTRDTRYLREEIRELEEHNQQMKEEVKDLQRDLTNEKRAAEKYSERISEVEKELKELRDENDQMRQDISDYKMQMQSQRENLVSRRGDDLEFREKLQRKNHELAEAMEELQNLTDANDTLEKRCGDLQHQMEDAITQMDRTSEDYLKLKAVLQETDNVTDKLRQENEILKAQVSDLTEQVQSRGESDDAIMVAVNNKIEEWKVLMGEKDQQVGELQDQVFKLRDQLIAANMDTDKASVAALGQVLKEKDKQIEELTEKVNQYIYEMDKNTAIIDDLREELHRAGSGPGDRMQTKVRELQNTLKSQKEQQRDIVKDAKKAEEDARNKDKELNEALERMREYEAGYGLVEAVAEIKEFKNQVKVRDRQIEELTQHINKAEMKINDMLDENEELRYRLKLDPKEPLDLTEFRKNKAIRQEEAKALNFQLQNEIEVLEEERRVLKNRLRKMAQQTGQRAVALGLTAEDMLAVQDYQEELKVRKTQGQPISTAAAILREVERRESSIRDEELGKEYKQNVREMNNMEDEVAHLRAQNKEMAQHNRVQEEALKELMEAVRQQPPGSARDLVKTHLGQFPSIDRMLAAIEAKKVIGSYDTSLYLKEQVDVLRGRNDELRNELRESRVEGNKNRMERDKAFDKIERMEKDHQAFQESGVAPGAFKALPLPEGMAVTSTEIIASLNEHLVVVLQEMALKEESMRKMDVSLENYKRKFAVMRHQQGLVYQEFLASKKEWEGECDKLKDQLKKVHGEREEDSVRIQEFDRLVDTLGKDDVEVRRRLADMTRKITTLRVNEKALTRRYQIMEEIDTRLRKELHQQRNEITQIQSAISERLGYLSRFKDMSTFKITQLQKTLEDSVPQSDMDKMNRRYHELTEKYRDLLEKGNNLVSKAEALTGLEAEVKRLTNDNEEIKTTLSLEKEKLHALEAAMEELHRRGVTEGMDVKVTDGDIISISKKITMLEMKELNERQRAEHAVRMYEQQRDILRELETRNKELEDKFSEVTKLNLEMQKTERDLRDELSDSVMKSVSDADRKKISQLEEGELTLKHEISKLKEVAEVATSQLKIYETQQVSHDKELQSLRQQLLDFQMQSDEKTIIGKLHRTIVQLQVSEGTAVRKCEEAKKKVTKLEAHVLRGEHRIDDKNQTIQHNRAEAQNKARYLKRSLNELRLQFAGAVPLSKQEKFSKNMMQLRQDKTKLEEELKGVRDHREGMRDKVAELKLQKESLQELISTLKDGRGAAKVLEWHSKIETVRLEELKQKRLNAKLHKQIKYLEGIIQSHELTIADFEADNVRVIKDYEERQLRWEQREVELERTVISLERQVEEIVGAASRFEQAVGSLPDSNLPISSQLEQAISTIKGNVKTILDTKAESKTLRQRNGDLEKQLRDTERAIIERDKLVAELRLRMPATADRDEIILKATSKVTTAMKKRPEDHDFESQQALKIAQSTMSSLQARIQQKEETIHKYQELLNQAREDMQDMNRRHEQELKAMQQKIHLNTDATFLKFKEAAQQLMSRQTTARGPTSKQLARLTELEDMVAEQENSIAALSEKMHYKEEEIITLRAKLQQTDRMHCTDKERYSEEIKAELSKKDSEIDDYRRQLGEQRKEMDILNEEIAALKDTNSRAPTQTMKNLVERLKNQLALKEKQHQSLSKALTDLRADMVTQAQDNVRAHAEDAGQEKNIQRLIDQHTKQMGEQIEDLQLQVERQKKEIKKRKENEHTLQTDLEDTREEFSQKERNCNKYKRDKERLEHEVDELEKKVERMNTMRTQRAGEFEKQQELDESRRRVRLLEDELKKRQTAEKPYEQKEDRTKTEEVSRWGESKKWQRTVEKMKVKIQEKDTELDKMKKANELSRVALERANREKESIEARSRAIARSTVSHVSAAPPGKAGHDTEELKNKNYMLQEEVANLRRQLVMDRDTSYKETQLRNQQLSEQVDQLESALAHCSTSGGVTTIEYQKLFEKNQDLQRQVLKLSEENIELRFEAEQARKDLPRMKDRIKDLQRYADALKMENAQLSGDTARSLGSSNTSIRRIGESGKSSRELEKTIALLKRVVERLQMENEQLKRAPGYSATDQAAMFKLENEALKKQLDELRETMGATLSDRYTSQQKGTARLMNDYEKMRKELMKEKETSEKLRVQLRSTELQSDHHHKELTDTRTKLEIEEAKRPNAMSSDTKGWKSAVVTRMYEEKIKGLEQDLEKKNKIVSDTKKLLRDAAEREQELIRRQDDLQKKIMVLERFPAGSQAHTSDANLMREYQQARLTIDQLEEQKKELLSEVRRRRPAGGSSTQLDDDVLTKAGNYDRVLRENVEVTMDLKSVRLERDKLRLEVDRLKKELESFGPEFFEEVEDLKYNYKQAVQKNVLYEEKLQQISTQFGISVKVPGI